MPYADGAEATVVFVHALYDSIVFGGKSREESGLGTQAHVPPRIPVTGPSYGLIIQ